MRLVDRTVKSRYTVNEVVSTVDVEEMRKEFEAKCEAVVMKVDASSMPSHDETISMDRSTDLNGIQLDPSPS